MTKRAQHPASVVVALAAIAACLPAGGCASPTTSGAAARTGADVTGGLEIEIFRTGDDQSFARYRVERDGTLRFGGGADAVGGSFSWSGPLTAEEIDRLRTLIARNRWSEADPPSTGRPPGRSYTITLRTRDRRRSFTVLGDDPGVVAVYALLDAAGRRRHRDFLDALPKAGMQR